MTIFGRNCLRNCSPAWVLQPLDHHWSGPWEAQGIHGDFKECGGAWYRCRASWWKERKVLPGQYGTASNRFYCTPICQSAVATLSPYLPSAVPPPEHPAQCTSQPSAPSHSNTAPSQPPNAKSKTPQNSLIPPPPGAAFEQLANSQRNKAPTFKCKGDQRVKPHIHHTWNTLDTLRKK